MLGYFSQSKYFKIKWNSLLFFLALLKAKLNIILTLRQKLKNYIELIESYQKFKMAKG